MEKSNNKHLRFLELEELIASPEIIAHNSYWRKLVAEQNSLKPVFYKREELTKAIKELEICKTNAENSDKAFQKLLLEEIEALSSKIDTIAKELAALLIEKKETQKYAGAILELKAMGENSYSFCKTVFNMYQNFSKNMAFQTEISSYKVAGEGIKEANIIAKGESAYFLFEHESAIHKNISTDKTQEVSVTVLPYIIEKEINIGDKDIKIDLFHSGGAGGQNVNKVETAVRITHMETGITVVCQDERSQLKNKERALKNLILRLKEENAAKQKDFIDDKRKVIKNTVKKEKTVREYDFIKDTVTDSRVKITFGAEEVIEGNFLPIIDAIKLKHK